MSSRSASDLSPNVDEDNVSTISPISHNEEAICEQLCHDLMTSSYTEISFDDSDEQTDIELGEESETGHSFCQQTSDGNKRLTKKLSSSLSLPQLSSTIVNWSERAKASYETENLNFNINSSFDQKQHLEEVPDFISYEGNAISYVAQDFHKKLKHSSSSPSIEGHSSPHSEVIDLKVLNKIERQAKQLSRNINTMLKHISESTHSITSLTVECISTYETCLNKTCDVIDSNIKSMYQLMAKCEELNQSMKPINKLTEEIKEVKRLLELFEKAVEYRM